MITLKLHNEQYIGLANCYHEREIIKSLAPYPEVKWDKASGLWLLDARLFWKVIYYLGDRLAPLSMEFVFGYPIHASKARQGRRAA